MAIVNQPVAKEGPNQSEIGEVVLVVEDEDEVRKVICLTLELQGYTVLAAAKPEEALNIARTHNQSIDLLLADVVMPDCSGPELAAQIRLFLPELRVLYISGYSEDAMLAHGLEADKTAFLPKPFTSAALGRKLRQVLREPHS